MAATSGLLVGAPPGILMATGSWPEDAAGIVVMGGIVATLGAAQLKSRENEEKAANE